jgi:hypothetical protein
MASAAEPLDLIKANAKEIASSTINTFKDMGGILLRMHTIPMEMHKKTVERQQCGSRRHAGS